MKIREYITVFKKKLLSFIKSDNKTTQLIINIIIILMLNIAGASLVMRFDLTKAGTYSLSKKSRELVANLDERLKIKVFFSDNLPAEHSAVSRYLKDILQEYNFHGNRNFSYEIVSQDNLEKEAADYGIRPVQSRELADDQIKVRNVYMGLVIQHADLIEKIEALTTPAGLEYEITSRIEKMTSKIDRLIKIKEPLNLVLYLDPRLKKLPIEGIDTLERVVEEAASFGNKNNYGKIKFQIINPADSGAEENPALYGIPGLRWKNVRTPSGELVKAGETAFGLVLLGEGRFSIIDINIVPTIFGSNAISGLESLEDKINTAVGDVLKTNRDVAYVVGHGIPELRDDRNPEGAALFNALLSDMYNLVEVDLTGNNVPPNIDVMIINGPVTEFSQEEKYRIDQFLMQGKSLLYFANSFVEIDPGQGQDFMGAQPMIFPAYSGLEEMFEHYGIKINKDVVLDLNCAQVNFGKEISSYPLMPVIRKEGLSKKNVATEYINNALFMKASSLEPSLNDGNKGLNYYELITTSPETWTMEGRVNFNPYSMFPPERSEMKSRIITALVSGKMESYFKDKKPLVETKREGALTRDKGLLQTPGSGESRLLVVGSSEIATSAFIDYAIKNGSAKGGGAYSNDVLLHGFVDYLAGNNYVPEMKGKSIGFTPLDRTDDRTRLFLKIINMALVPFLVILSGFVVWKRRIVRKKIIEQEFMKGVNI